MSKNTSQISKHEKQLIYSALKECVQRMKRDDSLEVFINQVLTESERLTVGRRLLIANLLLQGSTRMEINEMLSVSPNTVTNIKEWSERTFKNYDEVVAGVRNRSKHELRIQNRPEKLSFEALKKAYPTHYLLFTLADKLLKQMKNK